MPKPIFTHQGTDPDDYILVDGQKDWAIIPSNTLKGQRTDTPIRLRVGNDNYGEKHINLRHKGWLMKKRRTVPELVWEKLSLNGGVFFKDPKKNRTNLYVKIDPTAYLVMERHQCKIDKSWFFSVVTMFPKAAPKDLVELGKYQSNFCNPLANRALRRG
ncbi:hypothetical protein [Vibrio campbellii]|uniref:hypothetical protein n=1 Tax=Vibrio campbellii TaxID=680 RepID=UPI000CD3663F|nr:hypothetical protein [Vibrio campbellii]AUW07505.1 hypothetical protein C1N51_28220 [Vibrio campbellii]